jgi:hypothetical protein
LNLLAFSNRKLNEKQEDIRHILAYFRL